MPAEVRWRPQVNINFEANNMVSERLSRGMVYREIYLKLTGAATVAGAANIPANIARGDVSSVSGGEENEASDSWASVSGGFRNEASGPHTSVSGGVENEASGDSSSVSGGDHNEASGDSSSVSGGSNRNAPGPLDWAAGSLWEDN